MTRACCTRRHCETSSFAPPWLVWYGRGGRNRYSTRSSATYAPIGRTLIPHTWRALADLMNGAVRDAQVVGHERRIAALALPDPNDRHVLAAAIEADADLIVTKNLKDFPAPVLADHGLEAQHPDAFLLDLHWQRPGALPRIVSDIVATRRTGATIDDVLKALAVDTPSAAGATGDVTAG